MRRSRAVGAIVGLTLLGLVIQVFAVQDSTARAPTEIELEKARQFVSQQKVVDTDGWLSVSKSSPGRWTLGDGFSSPEVDGAWMTSESARVEFLSPPGKTPTSVSLRLLPNLGPAKPSRTLVVYTSIDDQIHDLQGGTTDVTLALDGERRGLVTIKCDGLDRPADIGAGADLRPLCVKLLAVRVTYDEQ